MKRLLFLLILAVVTSNLYAQSAKGDTITVQTKIYCNHCSECNTCKPHIEKELTFTKGVKSFKFDVQRQTITVIYNAKRTNPQTIRQAIANSGYDADEVKADPKAFAKLDDCCRGN